MDPLYGHETSRLYHQSWGPVYNGLWDWGQSKAGICYEKANNIRLQENSTGRVGGTINSEDYTTSRLESWRTTLEFNVLFFWLVDRTLTLEVERNHDQFNDPALMQATDSSGETVPGASGDLTQCSTKNNAILTNIYLEDNIEAVSDINLISDIRPGYHNQFGGNWSLSLSLPQVPSDMFTLKTGIVHVFKAPNFYQSSEGYLPSTHDNGYSSAIAEDSCYLLDNPGLDPEISINKETNIELNLNGYAVRVTWFRNDHKNKIVSGTEVLGHTSSGNNILWWQNGSKAAVEGLEGGLPILTPRDVLSWRTNTIWMLKSESRETGNPLSVTPKYIANTMLDWQVNDIPSANVDWTLCGRQKPRQYVEIRSETGVFVTIEADARFIVDIGTQYQLNWNIRPSVRISNPFDKQLYCENAGVSTYNESGRAYYVGVALSF